MSKWVFLCHGHYHWTKHIFGYYSEKILSFLKMLKDIIFFYLIKIILINWMLSKGERKFTDTCDNSKGHSFLFVDFVTICNGRNYYD